MKNLVCALVFLFPCVAFAQGKIVPLSEEQRRLHQNCCVVPIPIKERWKLGELKSRNPVRDFLNQRRLHFIVFDDFRSENGSFSIGRLGQHGKVYGIEYRQKIGILE